MVLHIANDYSGSLVYKNLVTNLDKLGVEQVIYTALRSEKLIGRNSVSFSCINSKIIYSNLLSKYVDRVFFNRKILKILKDLEAKVLVDKMDIIHAHTWYSDGGVALLLSKKYKIPYVVTIRNTDLNLFYKYMIHLRKFGEEILLNAERIVFISNVYRARFYLTSFYHKNKSILDTKMVVISNGIDDFWLNNVIGRREYLSNSSFKILYIGKFTKGKNVLRLIEAIILLNRDSSKKYSLTLIGGGGDQHKQVLNKIEKYPFLRYLGSIHEKEELAKQYRQHHLFAMVSKAETFGLVYLEAISQGLPILNTRNEGIYGMYENIGESVNYTSVSQIFDKIEMIRNSYENYNFDPGAISNNHNWLNIANIYKETYNLHK